LVDFRHRLLRTAIRLATGKYRQRQWHFPCAKLNGSHRRSWSTSFPITLYGPTCWLGRSGSKRRAAYCKAVALEPNSAGRRWLERKAALLVTP
jgi:hypothetical protein